MTEIVIDDSGFTKKSYSIEAEDLLIKRIFDAAVFKDPARKGVYLDLGAFHPILCSNTYYLYCLGWRGICVEPNPRMVPEFRALRPEDQLIHAGISNRSGVLEYHQFEESELNGFYDRDMIDFHVRAGRSYIGSESVECYGITEFIAKHIHREINLLDIDIETLDVRVLRAWDWSRCRPNVICVEIHSLTMRDMLESEIANLLCAQAYSAMSRGWQSAIFVANECLA